MTDQNPNLRTFRQRLGRFLQDNTGLLYTAQNTPALKEVIDKMHKVNADQTTIPDLEDWLKMQEFRTALNEYNSSIRLKGSPEPGCLNATDADSLKRAFGLVEVCMDPLLGDALAENAIATLKAFHDEHGNKISGIADLLRNMPEPIHTYRVGLEEFLRVVRSVVLTGDPEKQLITILSESEQAGNRAILLNADTMFSRATNAISQLAGLKFENGIPLAGFNEQKKIDAMNLVTDYISISDILSKMDRHGYNISMAGTAV